MLSLGSGGRALHEADTSLISEVTKMVRDEIDLLEVSSRCRVNPTTLRKILEERPVSRYVEKKIRVGLGFAFPPNKNSSRLSTVERLREIHRLYREKGTLAAVGRTMGLSRERVRQLLVRGAKIGLFEYDPWRLPSQFRKRSSKTAKDFSD